MFHRHGDKLHSIKDGAIFVADAHYPHHGDDFLSLLKLIDSKKIEVTQLFLMGDIFDLLFSCGEYIKTFSQEAIYLLQKLSKEIEIFYFEGNHDFCLSPIFPDIKLYPRNLQPVLFLMGEKKIYLSHGDLYDVGLGYEIYSYVIRNCRAICPLLPFEKRVIDFQMDILKKKSICKDFKDFDKKVSKILSFYPKDADLVIEGHFHQGKKRGIYISLPSLACQKRVGVADGGEINFKTVESLIADKLVSV